MPQVLIISHHWTSSRQLKSSSVMAHTVDCRTTMLWGKLSSESLYHHWVCLGHFKLYDQIELKWALYSCMYRLVCHFRQAVRSSSMISAFIHTPFSCVGNIGIFVESNLTATSNHLITVSMRELKSRMAWYGTTSTYQVKHFFGWALSVYMGSEFEYYQLISIIGNPWGYHNFWVVVKKNNVGYPSKTIKQPKDLVKVGNF